MAKQQRPFRTLKMPLGVPDHFTIEQADAAVLAVMAERGETPRLDVVEDSHLRPRRSPGRRSRPSQAKDAAL